MLMLATAAHLNRKYERVFAYLQDDAKRRHPRVELMLNVFGSSAAERLALRDRLSPDAPLLRSGFVRLAPPPEGPHESWLSQPVVVDPRLVRFLLGQPGADPVVEAMRYSGEPPPTPSGLQRALDGFGRALALDPRVVGMLETDDPLACLHRARALAAEHDRALLDVDVSRPAAHVHPIGARVRRAFDEARLSGSLLLLLGLDSFSEIDRGAALDALSGSLVDVDVPVLVVARGRLDLRDLGDARLVLNLTATEPDTEERIDLWRKAGGELDPQEIREVAWRFRLGSTQIRRASMMSRLLGAAQSPARKVDAPPLTRACQIQSRHKLDELAQRVRPCFRWSDLILPESSVGQLETAVAHIRHHETVFHRWGLGRKSPHGQGLVVLFSGPPGTGKTMSASLMASDAGWELFRINLSTVVSKYIGETEKNLERVFNAAWRSNAVIFFDEADAFFGKRTQVKDAHDRHANIETSYLLQRLETYDGVVILATNLKKNIDDAFLRRIQIMVDFPFPTPEMRHRLWRTLIPPPCPPPMTWTSASSPTASSSPEVRSRTPSRRVRSWRPPRGVRSPCERCWWASSGSCSSRERSSTLRLRNLRITSGRPAGAE